MRASWCVVLSLVGPLLAGMTAADAALASADTTHRLVIELVGGSVKRFRVGRSPQVEYVEGCS